jgi:oligoribonuclease (3'-5' exoribonuclease)
VADPILILDLETMGLEHTDPILEIAAILVDPERLDPIGRPFHSLVAPPGFDDEARQDSSSQAVFIDYAMATQCNPQAAKMHHVSGLWQELMFKEIVQIWRVDSEIRKWLTGTSGTWMSKNSRILLAGSGVAQFDLHVIRRQMPLLASLLHYRTVDVSPVREFLTRVCLYESVESGELQLPITHRALADCQRSLAELRAWRARLVPLLGSAE